MVPSQLSGWSERVAPMSLLLYVLSLEPLLRRLRDEKANPVLIEVPIGGCVKARVSAFADDITVFVSRCLDIETVKNVTKSKVNSDQSKGLRLSAWRSGVPLPGSFRFFC